MRKYGRGWISDRKDKKTNLKLTEKKPLQWDLGGGFLLFFFKLNFKVKYANTLLKI